MIDIDQNDNLYKFLKDLGAEDINKDYIELASNGRYTNNEIRAYLKSKFEPSLTSDVPEEELEKLVDYYVDIKKIKKLSKSELKNLLKMYYDTQDESIKEIIINSCLKDVLHMCINYYTLHKVDIQDLIQVANIGIIQALNKYSPKSKLDFYDYVLYWTRFEIIKEFEEKK